MRDDYDESSLSAKIALATWRTFVQLFYIGVVILVLVSLQGRLETIVVCLFGILYVTVRSIGIGLSSTLSALAVGLQAELNKIKAGVNQDYFYDEELARESREALAKASVPLWFAYAGLSTIAFICTLRLLYVLLVSNSY